MQVGMPVLAPIVKYHEHVQSIQQHELVNYFMNINSNGTESNSSQNKYEVE
jgi:hypothetical protein